MSTFHKQHTDVITPPILHKSVTVPPILHTHVIPPVLHPHACHHFVNTPYLFVIIPRITIPAILYTSYFTNIHTYLSSLHTCMPSLSSAGAVTITPSENTIQTVLTYLRRQQRKRKPTEQCRRTSDNYLKRYLRPLYVNFSPFTIIQN